MPKKDIEIPLQVGKETVIATIFSADKRLEASLDKGYLKEFAITEFLSGEELNTLLRQLRVEIDRLDQEIESCSSGLNPLLKELKFKSHCVKMLWTAYRGAHNELYKSSFYRLEARFSRLENRVETLKKQYSGKWQEADSVIEHFRKFLEEYRESKKEYFDSLPTEAVAIIKEQDRKIAKLDERIKGIDVKTKALDFNEVKQLGLGNQDSQKALKVRVQKLEDLVAEQSRQIEYLMFLAKASGVTRPGS